MTPDSGLAIAIVILFCAVVLNFFRWMAALEIKSELKLIGDTLVRIADKMEKP